MSPRLLCNQCGERHHTAATKPDDLARLAVGCEQCGSGEPLSVINATTVIVADHHGVTVTRGEDEWSAKLVAEVLVEQWCRDLEAGELAAVAAYYRLMNEAALAETVQELQRRGHLPGTPVHQ